MRSFLARLAVIIVATGLAGSALAFDPASTAPVNLDPAGVTLKGYDPVAYFSGTPTPGDPGLTAAHDGATYQFASAENRDAFLADPVAYAPAYGGFCAMAMSLGYKVDIDPNAWKIVDDRLYVQANERATWVWETDIPGNISKADGFWPDVMNKAPSDLR
ncbi:MAG: YHS domain-containing (seleno)protein [Bauldia litoralis]